MKKFLGSLVGLLLVFVVTFASVTAFAADDKVEISFCVGDDTLMINGESVRVEKPYVVGAGVTLVPLRVITEAFGATVEWIDSTQSVNLLYPDVNISLQINNPVAEVNGKAETLLSAPELTKSGFTMVPLRFISENFGADVSYDDKTERIVVVKKKADNGHIVQGAVEEQKIGDSYFKWSMDNPVGMNMAERNFDGTYTLFKYDENNWFDITVGIVGDDYDFEKDYATFKNSLSGYTLVKADKDTKNADKKVMHFQAKDKRVFMDIWQFVTKDYAFLVAGDFETSNDEYRQEGCRIMSTFDCVFNKAGTYDLSSSKNGVRKYESESMRFSVDIPEDFYIASSEDVENELAFLNMNKDDDDSAINIGIYSKSAVVSAKDLAEQDYNGNKTRVNEKIAVYSESVVEKEYEAFKAFEYSATVNGKSVNFTERDVFFELGDYVYNISVTLQIPDADVENKIDKIVNSFKARELNASQTGILMRNDPVEDGVYTAKGSGWSLEVPNNYIEVAEEDDGVVLQSVTDGTIMYVQVFNGSGMTLSQVSSSMKEIENEYKKQTGATIVQSAKQVTINGTRFVESVFFTQKEGDAVYTRQLACLKGGKMINFIISYHELMYSQNNILKDESIISSLKIK